jgi:hypothetical protein
MVPLAFPLLLCLISTPFLSKVMAQSAAGVAAVPQPAQEMAFMLAGSYLYVTGGKYQVNNQVVNVTGQTFSLDLSKPWSVQSPPWKQLASGPVYNLYNGVATPDNQTLITFYQASTGFTINTYNIQQNAWSSETLSNTPNELRQGVRPVIDPKNGTVYINAAVFLDVYDPKSNKIWYDIYPPASLTARDFSAACYNSARRSIMYHGGMTLQLNWEASAYITEYSLDTYGWSILVKKTHTTLKGLFATCCHKSVQRSKYTEHCRLSIFKNGSHRTLWGTFLR